MNRPLGRKPHGTLVLGFQPFPLRPHVEVVPRESLRQRSFPTGVEIRIPRPLPKGALPVGPGRQRQEQKVAGVTVAGTKVVAWRKPDGMISLFDLVPTELPRFGPPAQEAS